MKKISITLVCALVLSSVFLFAHTPLCFCYDNGDGTVTCEGGFSDGSSAAGVDVRVIDKSGTVLIKGKFDKNSEFMFKRPKGNFTVVFDAGPGHVLKIDSSKIS